MKIISICDYDKFFLCQAKSMDYSWMNQNNLNALIAYKEIKRKNIHIDIYKIDANSPI